MDQTGGLMAGWIRRRHRAAKDSEGTVAPHGEFSQCPTTKGDAHQIEGNGGVDQAIPILVDTARNGVLNRPASPKVAAP